MPTRLPPIPLWKIALCMVALAFLCLTAFMEAVIPDADDCAAANATPDCWRDEALYQK